MSTKLEFETVQFHKVVRSCPAFLELYPSDPMCTIPQDSREYT